MTVKELKEIIRDWPEIGVDGEPTEVWVTTGDMLSSPATMCVHLNSRMDVETGKISYDLLIDCELE